MSIERMENVALLVPSKDRERFIEWLYRERQVHLDEFGDISEASAGRFRALEEDASVSELQISRLQGAIEFLREVQNQPSDFLEGIFPIRMLATREEIENALSSTDPETLSANCGRLRDAMEKARDRRESILSEKARLLEIDFLTASLGALKKMRHLSFRIAAAAGQAQKSFLTDPRMTDDIVVVTGSGTDSSATYIIAAPLDKTGVVEEVLSEYGLREIPLPRREGTVRDELAALETELKEAVAGENEIRAEAVGCADQTLRKAEYSLAWWESERTKKDQQTRMVGSGTVFAARGFIRTGNIEEFGNHLAEAFPGAVMERLEVPREIDPPVSVTWNRFFRPAGLLVKMFGLPTYRSVDPTVFLTLSFLIFFGICYGDLLYGLMLLYIAHWLKKRFRGQKHLIEFFRLFTYGAVSTIIFGVATGSWGADLTSYFGEGNPLDRLRLKLTLLDPMTKPMIALGIAIGIGITNQLYGIFLRFYQNFRRGDIADSIYDGVFWLVYLVSILTLGISLALSAPKGVIYTSLALTLIMAVGLVLTQGRHEKSLIGRYITGLVSLYGILGTYGTTAFMGDVISYSRLMALGLTTTVVGMSFNIIAGMLKEVPYVGWLLFIGMVIFGHVFNFAMSILTAFVHSARLILLEWFGRFYEGGGTPFRPFGFQSSRMEMIEGGA
jgi:V/A-type H+/Na+-transporting ATPase subunit I